MTIDISAAKKYAKALYELSSTDNLDQVRDQLNQIAAVFAGSKELQYQMKNPAVEVSAKVNVMSDIAKRLAAGSAHLSNIVSLLAVNKRIDLLPAIAQHFAEIVARHQRMQNVQVVSARQIPDSERATLLETLRRDLGAKTSVEWSVDASLLGGMQVRAGDTLLDGSVRYSLEQLREQLAR